jgi:PAS domain S-box-containing protein
MIEMKSTKKKAPTGLPGESLVPLESVLCTEDLNRRPSRPPDYEKESRALTALAQALADSPHTILQQLAETILEVCQCESAGISLLTTDDGGKRFHWPAIAGVWKPHIGGGTPRDFGPCGDVLDRNVPLLFRHFERRYPYFLPVTPPVEECLLVPFYVGGKAVGTIWAIAHSDRRKFDAEDMRQLVSLGNFASAAYKAVAFLDALEQRVEASSRLAAIVDSSDDAIVSKDLNGVITSWNRGAEQLFGYTAQEAVGQPATLLMPPERVDEETDILEHIRRAEVVDHYETVRRRKDGTLFDASVTVSPIRNNRGQVIGESKIARDITERKQSEKGRARLADQVREANEQLVVGTVRADIRTEDAEQANHLKDEFLATVSHELRTPLNALLGWARMLGSKQLPPDREGHAIVTIERNAATLAHLIDDLLDVSRIVAGTLRLAPQAVDLVAVAQAALEVVRPLAVTKNVQLAFSPDLPATETVSGDAGRLQQVMLNLLANAIKFTPGGRVDVFIERSNDHVEVRVVDTGQGISPDFLPHVFDRFRQADDATTRRHTGLGLGLAIVRRLVELHRGTVRAASPGVGRGATFTVRLPIAAGEAQGGQAAALTERRTAASTASPMPRLPRLDDLRLLVVDDSADGRTLTSLVLTQAGASVTAVASVREALQLLEVERPDALVADIGLPDEDGYGLIGQIRQYEAEHGGFLPAVALTGYTRAEDRARILAAGFQVHVPKPVDPVELTAAIATMMHDLRDSEP